VLELKSQLPLADLLKQAELPRSTFYYQKQALAVDHTGTEKRRRMAKSQNGSAFNARAVFEVGLST
jgi:hypothetical protein